MSDKTKETGILTASYPASVVLLPKWWIPLYKARQNWERVFCFSLSSGKGVVVEYYQKCWSMSKFSPLSPCICAIFLLQHVNISWNAAQWIVTKGLLQVNQCLLIPGVLAVFNSLPCFQSGRNSDLNRPLLRVF